MRKLAFGYSTRCNIRCGHCVASEELPDNRKMSLDGAKTIIMEMARAGVSGISFTAGEPFVYLDDMVELIGVCRGQGIYTRIVTNSSWAKSRERAEALLSRLRQRGLCQVRLSYSRWHQEQVPRENVLNAARAAEAMGLDYFVSFVTDFSEADDPFEAFLREHNLKFFPEPLIYSGRAETFARNDLFTDFQANRCAMNPYLSPDLDMFACCDAGSKFTRTNFFYLGNLATHSVSELFEKSETHPLYNHIRTMGITAIASFAGFKAREIVKYRKCELCKLLFDSPESLAKLSKAAEGELTRWTR